MYNLVFFSFSHSLQHKIISSCVQGTRTSNRFGCGFSVHHWEAAKDGEDVGKMNIVKSEWFRGWRHLAASTLLLDFLTIAQWHKSKKWQEKKSCSHMIKRCSVGRDTTEKNSTEPTCSVLTALFPEHQLVVLNDAIKQWLWCAREKNNPSETGPKRNRKSGRNGSRKKEKCTRENRRLQSQRGFEKAHAGSAECTGPCFICLS